MGTSVSEEDSVEKTILIGPTSMEAGWLLQFVARARCRSRRYKTVIVYCEEGYEYLFEDFATKTISYKYKSGNRDRWLLNGKRLDIGREIVEEFRPDKIYGPNEKHCIKDFPEFFLYGRKSEEKKYNILIHARSLNQHDWIDKKAGGSRNYPLKKYNKLVSMFPKYLNVTMASIGSKGGAMHIPETVDLRGIPLEDLCNVMASSGVCIGTSSFPLHLANACGCKTVVFTDDSYQKSIGATNRKRYEKLWRFTKADVVVLDKWGWIPGVSVVAKSVWEAIFA